MDPGIGGRVREIDGKPITKLDSPKATIMALVTDGILTQKLPWGLVLIGVFLTFAIELMGLQSLPSRSESICRFPPRPRCSPVGWSAGWWSAGSRPAARTLAEVESGPGVLFSSGLIAGGAHCAGVAIAGNRRTLVARAEAAHVPAADYLAHVVGLERAVGAFATSDLAAFAAFIALAAVLYRVAKR